MSKTTEPTFLPKLARYLATSGESASNDAQAAAPFAGAVIVTWLAGAQPLPLSFSDFHVVAYHSAPLSHCVWPLRASGKFWPRWTLAALPPGVSTIAALPVSQTFVPVCTTTVGGPSVSR